MLEIGDICPDWNFLGPFNERVTISMPPIAGKFSILIFYHPQNKVLETIYTKVSDNRELLDSLDVRLFSITSLNKQSQPFMLPGLGAQPNFNTGGLVQIPGEQKAGAMKLMDDGEIALKQVEASPDNCALLTLEPNQHIFDIQNIDGSNNGEQIEQKIEVLFNKICNRAKEHEDSTQTLSLIHI